MSTYEEGQYIVKTTEAVISSCETSGEVDVAAKYVSLAKRSLKNLGAPERIQTMFGNICDLHLAVKRASLP